MKAQVFQISHLHLTIRLGQAKGALGGRSALLYAIQPYQVRGEQGTTPVKTDSFSSSTSLT